ncbi:hypothetical protein F4805DRAFT_262195 [Annulohypoxylon moriforme]|nr:hypothetical protein F4805DRAFT_262195 [Annulohypoxylon moriforme]
MRRSFDPRQISLDTADMDAFQSGMVVTCERCAVLMSQHLYDFDPPPRYFYRCPRCHAVVSVIVAEPPHHDPRDPHLYSPPMNPYVVDGSAPGSRYHLRGAYHGTYHGSPNGYTQHQGAQGPYRHAAVSDPGDQPYFSPIRDADLGLENGGTSNYTTFGGHPYYNHVPEVRRTPHHVRRRAAPLHGAPNGVLNALNGPRENPFASRRGRSPGTRRNARVRSQERRNADAVQPLTNGVNGHDHTSPENNALYTPPESHASIHSQHDSQQDSSTSSTTEAESVDGIDGVTNPFIDHSDDDEDDENIPPIAFTTTGETLLLGSQFLVPTAAEAQFEAGPVNGQARVFSTHETEDGGGDATMVEIEEDLESTDLSMSSALQ